MKCKPIIFGTQMVQAILEGRKTMTRRVIHTKYDNTELVMRTDKYGTRIVERQTDAMPNHLIAIIDKQPTYNVGDILWVRETWRKWVGGYSYKADAQDTFQWRSARYMPKKAARIFLRVTDVRAERLQDITENDVVAEGAEKLITCQHQHGIIESDGTLGDMCWNSTQACSFCTMGMAYSELFGKIVWDSLNAKRGYGWDKNPWVWAYSFERTDKPEGWPLYV